MKTSASRVEVATSATMIQLQLTLEDAQVLRDIMGLCSSADAATGRIYDALQAAGVVRNSDKPAYSYINGGKSIRIGA